MKGPNAYSKSEFLELLQDNGKWINQPSQRIAIVGAGMAGLIAGWLLKKAGHRIRIFEASNTVGGRIKTLRDGFSPGSYAEAGAMRIPENHRLTLWLTTALCGLKTAPFIPFCDNGLISINTKRITFGEYKRNPKDLGFDLSPEEMSKTAEELFASAILAYIRGSAGLNWPNFTFENFNEDQSQAIRDRKHHLLLGLDQYSLRSFLSEEAKVNGNKLSKGAVAMLCSVLATEMEMSVSLAELLNDHFELHGSGKRLTIVGGMDQLPKSFVGLGSGNSVTPNLTGNVHYRHRVVEIRAYSGKHLLRVRTENPITRHRSNYDFDFVVVALPFSALRHIFMPGLLSRDKELAVRQLHYQNACKILLEFKNRFWEQHFAGEEAGTKPIIGGYSITDRPIRQIYYPTEGNVLLASYTWGDDSLRWTSLKRDDRIRFALRDLAIVHGRDPHQGVNVLEEIFVGGVSHSWAEDEFTSGAFAAFEPYQRRELFEVIWKPEAHIHYCGEHTSTKHGWIEGAVESGIRAAREVYETIEKLPPTISSI